MAVRAPVFAEKHLEQQLERQAKAMRRRQVSDSDVGRELPALEFAIRAELWRQVLYPPLPTRGG
jgi:hypothetical protein